MNFSKLKECLDNIIIEYNTPGLDCIVYKEHKEIFRYYTGYSDIEHNKPINGNELYLIFSMTKMLTCTCALRLFEQGKFLMDDPLSKHMSEFSKMKITQDSFDSAKTSKIAAGSFMGESIVNTFDGYAKNPITIKDLFTMRAGLNYDLNAQGIKEAKANGKSSTRDLVSAMSQTVLGFEPGTRFRYSLCHDVLGALIEIWSGMSFGEYMKKNLFDPLGMKNSFFGIPKDEERLSKMATIYSRDLEGNVIRSPLKCDYILADGYESGGAGLVSSTEDYALFLDALANNGIGKTGERILSPSSIELMRTNQLSGDQIADFNSLFQGPGYGYGLGVRTHINPKESGSISPLGEFGWDGAAGGFSMVDVNNKISLTYFQEMHGWSKKIQNNIKNALYKSLEL